MKNTLFQDTLKVVNIGLPSFAETIQKEQGSVVALKWQPPAGGNKKISDILARLYNNKHIEHANKLAFEAYSKADPFLIDIDIAKNIIPELNKRIILHAGPPIAYKKMCGPMQGAIIGAILYERWAHSLLEAENLAAGGSIEYAPAHHVQAVGPMAGIISPSMPLWVIEEAHSKKKSYSNLNEGLGKVLRFGANDDSVITRLQWMGNVLAPLLKESIKSQEPINLKSLQAQALHMGDEVHNRNVAASGLFLKKILKRIFNSSFSQKDKVDVVDFICNNDHFFLNLSMASCKAMLQCAENIAGSTLTTVMARNGVEFGIRVSGCKKQWFTTNAPIVDGLFFPGYTKDDAAPDLGDSAITETAGVGGFAMAASPSIVQFVGGSPNDALMYSKEMQQITYGQNSALTLPQLNFIGTAALIDIRKVVDSGILPIINTGIAHKKAGVGQVGAGITRAPLDCFTKALEVFDVSNKEITKE